MTIILSKTDFQDFFTERFLGIYAVNCLLKILPQLVYVATLPCETLMLEN